MHRLIEELQPIHRGHLDVRHHHTDPALLDELQRVSRVARADRAEAEAPKRLLKHLDHRGFVVEDAHRHGVVGTAWYEVAFVGWRSHGVHARSWARAMPKSHAEAQALPTRGPNF
jgi:hypothetical protein